MRSFRSFLLTIAAALPLFFPPLTQGGGFTETTPSVNGIVQSVAEIDQGMILISGPFTTVNGLNIGRIARLFPDGRNDLSFQADADDEVIQVLPRSGGGYVALGRFKNIGGSLEPYLAALLVNGRRDLSVSYGLQSVPAVGLIQPDEKIIVGGSTLRVNGISRGTLVRFLPNGPLDASFTANITGAVNGIQLMTNGKLIIWGSFTAVDGVPRSRMARLLPNGSLDASFIPPAFTGAGLPIQIQVVEQPDGKLLVGGAFSAVAGVSSRGMVRLLADGGRDPDFSADFNAGGMVRSVVLQQNGMILAGGTFSSVNGTVRNNAARLFPNGTLDPSWNPNLNGAVHSIALQESGGILLAGDFTSASAGPRIRLYGEGIAPTQSAVTLEDANLLKWARSGHLAALQGVRFELLNGSAEWMDLGAASEVDGGWQLAAAPIPVSATIRARGVVRGSPGGWRTGRLQVGSGIPIVGLVTAQGQVLSTGGTLDFDGLPAPPGTLSRNKMISLMNRGSGVLSATTFIVTGPHAGDFTLTGITQGDLTPGERATLSVAFKPQGIGIRTATLAITSNAPDSPHVLALRGEGTAGVISAVFRHPQDEPLIVETLPFGLTLGPLVLGFHPQPGTVLRVVDNRHPTATSPPFSGIQPLSFLTAEYGGISYQFQLVYTGGSGASLGNDVVLVLAGPGTLRRRIHETTVLAGLPDGRLVMNTSDVGSPASLIFTSSTGRTESAFSDSIISNNGMVVRDDSKLLIVDSFPAESSLRLRQLLPDGRPDPGFPAFTLPLTLNPEQMAVGPDGTVIISSLHPSGNGRGLLRLPPGASVPVAFGPPMYNSLTRNGIGALAVQPDGKILVGSVFENSQRAGMVRLMPDGSLDSSFNANLPLGGAYGVTRIIVQPDARILICGEFQQFPGNSLLCLQRLLPNGNLDTTFMPNLEANIGGIQREVTSMALQADGRIIIGGDFTWLGGRARNRLARLLPDGTLDPTFTPDVNQIVQMVSLTSSGEVAITGNFSIVNSTATVRGALLENDPPVSLLSVVVADNSNSLIRWVRGGSLPEADQVTFEVSSSSPGGWTKLGKGQRTSGGWELGGLALPAQGRIRARARYSSGYGGGCSSLQETISSYPVERTPQQRWREDYFNTPDNTGEAADLADPDFDGQPNYMEFAFGSHPVSSLQSPVPQYQRSVLLSNFSLDFTAKAGAEHFGYSAEWAADTQIASAWNISRNVGRRPDWTFREVLAGRPRQFGRLRVVLPANNP
jgi:uncharacterized delta-60 repeat protein